MIYCSIATTTGSVREGRLKNKSNCHDDDHGVRTNNNDGFRLQSL